MKYPRVDITVNGEECNFSDYGNGIINMDLNLGDGIFIEISFHQETGNLSVSERQYNPDPDVDVDPEYREILTNLNLDLGNIEVPQGDKLTAEDWRDIGNGRD